MSGRGYRSRSRSPSGGRRGSRDRDRSGYGTYKTPSSMVSYNDRPPRRDSRDPPPRRDSRDRPPPRNSRDRERLPSRDRDRALDRDYDRDRDPDRRSRDRYESPERRGGGPVRRFSPLPPRRIAPPYARPPPEPLDDRDPEILRVAATTLPQRVAGAIAGRLRKGDHTTLEAPGSGAAHQALKACAIARTYLEEDRLDLSVQVEWLDSSRYYGGEDKVMRFLIFDHRPRPYRIKAQHPMKVAAHTKPEKTAGAIAMDVRGDIPCSVSCLGAESAYQCLRALILARSFLQNEKLDFDFQPFYVDPDSNVLACHIERMNLK